MASILTTRQFVKEVRLYNLTKLILQRYKKLSTELINENRVLSIKRNISNLFSFLDLNIQNIESNKTQLIDKEFSSSIEFRNVSFRYPDSKEYAVKKIVLQIKKGEKIAIVGNNGAGKTTLIKLLTQLHSPTEGEIFIDGKNIKDIEKVSYYKNIGVVFQDFAQYFLSVNDNIAFGNLTHINNPDKIKNAAKCMGIHDKINSLPRKYQTTLGRVFDENSSDLSTGQWLQGWNPAA